VYYNLVQRVAAIQYQRVAAIEYQRVAATEYQRVAAIEYHNILFLAKREYMIRLARLFCKRDLYAPNLLQRVAVVAHHDNLSHMAKNWTLSGCVLDDTF